MGTAARLLNSKQAYVSPKIEDCPTDLRNKVGFPIIYLFTVELFKDTDLPALKPDSL